MKRKLYVCLILFSAGLAAGCPGESNINSTPQSSTVDSADDGVAKPIPTRPGNYHKDGWRYIYSIERGGSQSERRIGHLLRKGVRIKGKVGETIDTPFGQFRYFGKDDPENRKYNIGWLNTMTIDQPVFEEKDVSVPAAGNIEDS